MAQHLDKNLVQFLIVLVIAIGSGIFNWIKKQRAAKERETETWNQPAPPPPPPSRASNWEEEMRRLLGGEEPVAPAPPPVIVSRPAPPPPPLPLPVAQRTVAVAEPEGPDVELPALTEASTVYNKAAQLNEKVSQFLHGVSAQMGRLDESASAYERAAQLDQQVPQEMRANIAQAVTVTTSAHRAIRNPLTGQTVAMFRTRVTARQAFVASLILGPPKALEA